MCSTLLISVMCSVEEKNLKKRAEKKVLIISMVSFSHIASRINVQNIQVKFTTTKNFNLQDMKVFYIVPGTPCAYFSTNQLFKDTDCSQRCNFSSQWYYSQTTDTNTLCLIIRLKFMNFNQSTV